MLRLSENQHGAAATERALRFIGIRLAPHTHVEALRERLKALRVSLRDSREALAEAVEQRIAATVEIEYRDLKINRKVSEVSALMRAALQRSEPGRAALSAAMPMTPSDAVKGMVDATQSRFVETLCQQLESNPELATWKAEAPALRALEADAQRAVTAREALYVTEGQVRTQVKLQVARAQRDYNLAFAELTLAFPDDADRVESFFWRDARGADPAEEAPGPTPPEA